jgi:hypothetical protein
MPGSFNKPEAITVEWLGPYSLEEAAAACLQEGLTQGLYVAFGAPKAVGWWPYYWEARWVGRPSRLSNRLARTPLQYIGISKELCGRINLSGHKKLKLLSPRGTDIWFANPISHLDAEAKNGFGHQLAVSALEKALIYSLKPRLNEDEVETTSAPLCVGWCLAKRARVQLGRHKKQLARLPTLLRFDPEGCATVEFEAAKRVVRFRVRDFDWHPALPASVAFPKFLARLSRRVTRFFGIKVAAAIKLEDRKI